MRKSIFTNFKSRKNNNVIKNLTAKKKLELYYLRNIKKFFTKRKFKINVK